MDKDKGKKLNDGIFDILLGSMIMTGANFTGGAAGGADDVVDADYTVVEDDK